MDKFLKLEDAFQEKFANIEMNFEPKRLLCVNVLRTRDVSVSWIRDKFDEPDPQIRVTCPSLPKPNIFRTKVQKNSPTSEINETFKFVLPQDMPRPCLIEVDLFDSDFLLDDHIGKQTFDVSEYKEDILYQKTLDFTSNSSSESFRASHGELDLGLKIESRQRPDFRLGHELSEEERTFRKKRIPLVCNNVTNLFPENAPDNISETPVISLCGSGGGHRAIIGMSGAMEALKDADLLDVFTYAAGVSGSAWYLTSTYARQSYKKEEQAKFHDLLRGASGINIFSKGLSPSNVMNFRRYLSETKKLHSQPVSTVDLFGFTAGELFIGHEKNTARLSDLREYVQDGTVPYLLFVSLHAKTKVSTSKFHVYMEGSPHEVAFPQYGIGIKPENFGSVWSSGFVVRKCPEHPIHFHQGVAGSALAVFAETNIETGEKDKDLLDYIDGIRSNSDSSVQTDLIESDDDRDDGDEKEEGSSVSSEESKSNETSILAKLKNMVLSSRDSIITRSGKAFNFSLNFQSLEPFELNPFGGTEFVGPNKEDLIKVLGQAKKHKMSTARSVISLIDAGIYVNVPTGVLLRPQRTSDLLVVMDFSADVSDSTFSYMTLLTAASNAWSEGLKFPPVDFKQILNLPPKECLVFEDENDLECPIVVWFTLCNKTFRNLKDYKPRNPKYASMKDFNDFPVFDPGNTFSTAESKYDALPFERLHELAYHNVTSNIHEVKNAIVRAIERKKKRLQTSGL